MILLIAGAFVALAAAFAGGAGWMWRRTEVRLMEVGTLRERDAEKLADDTGQDLIAAALPSERKRGRGKVYDWSAGPELSR